MNAKKRGAGGKLSRSEVVTVRLDPKLRFAAELAARKQRRTLSSFIEWSIEKAVSEEVIRSYQDDGDGDTALYAMYQVWDVEEADRFIKFAYNYPELLNFDEERLWKLIKEKPYFWMGVEKKIGNKLIWETELWAVRYARVREHWETLNKIIAGELSDDAIPKIPKDEIIEKEIPY